MKRILFSTFLALLAAVGLVAVAMPAEATTLNVCSQYARDHGAGYICTTVTGTVTVYDRNHGVNKTLHLGDTVSLYYWGFDLYGLCGTHGDHYIWSIVWIDSGGNLHWAVIGDTWLNTGTHSEWGPHVADPYGHPFDPNFGKSGPNTTVGHYCNSSFWNYMGG